MMDTKILILLFLSVAVNIVMYVVPDGEPKDYFLFADQIITLKAHVYYACEYVERMCVLCALYFALPRYQKMLKVFFFIEVIAFIQYLFAYGHDMLIEGFDMNTVKLITYGAFIAYYLLKNNHHKLYERTP